MKSFINELKEIYCKSTIEYKFFIFIAFVSLLFSIIAAILNFSLHLGTATVIFPLLFGIVLLVTINLSLKKQKHILLSYIFIVILSVLFYPAMWITTGGSQGSIALFYVFNGLLIAILLNKSKKIYMVILQIVMLGGLYAFDYLLPQYIIPYESDIARIFDLSFTFLIMSIFLYFIIYQVMKEYNKKIQELQLVQEELRILSTIDMLSSLYNRRYIMDELKIRINDENSHPITLVMLDIDDFKSINDTYGHIAGDKVIIAIGDILKENTSLTSTVGRIGGEEFLISMYNTDLDSAIKITESIRLAMQNIKLSQEAFGFTISSGVYQCNKGEALSSCLEKTDKLMYKAKAKGKNQTSY